MQRDKPLLTKRKHSSSVGLLAGEAFEVGHRSFSQLFGASVGGGAYTLQTKLEFVALKAAEALPCDKLLVVQMKID